MADLADHLSRMMSGGEGEEESALLAGNSLEDIFREEPVPLDVFVQDKKFLGNPPLGPIQRDVVAHLERIYYPDLYPLMAAGFDPSWGVDLPMKNIFTICIGKGAGKDHMVRISALRIIYLLLCLKDAHAYFELPWQDSFHILNVAANRDLARRAFFEPMARAVDKGWFEGKANPLKNSITFDGGIEAISGSSDGDTQDGLNLILSVADEVDAFNEPDPRRGGDRVVSRSAGEMLKMMQSSGASRFYRTYKHARISYPRYMNSPIDRLRMKAEEDIAQKAAEGKLSVHYSLGPLATWEVNPRYDKMERITIPECPIPIPNTQAIIEEFQEDPDNASCKYLARPQRSSDTYFKNFHAVDSSFVTVERNPIEVEYEFDGTRWFAKYDIDPSLKPIEGASYVMHADLAKNGDSAGVSMSHVVRYEEKEKSIVTADGRPANVTEPVPFVRNDFTLAFSGDVRSVPAREIQVWWVRDLVSELRRRGFYIERVTYDGYESLDSRQILEQWGIETDRVSADINAGVYRNLRDMIYEGRLEIPFRQKLRDEITQLRKLANGKVDHPPRGSKDESDALACSVLGAIEVGGCESEEQKESYFGGVSVSSANYSDFGAGIDIESLAWGSELPVIEDGW